MKPVVREFVADVDEDQQATGDAKGEAQDIDDGVRSFFPKVSNGNDQVVAQHVDGFRLSQHGSQNLLQK